MQTSTNYDLAVIGGGINGAGIAADAASRGLKVILFEQNDLASATSSNSSKLIHGGLRYLEYYEFRLVREALAEREVLLKNAPHIIKPLEFILPHQPHLRPAWMIRIGLFLYDHLAKRVSLPASKGVRFDNQSDLVPSIKKGFSYADAWVDDARLVVLNALAAQQSGADICTQTQVESVSKQQNLWHLQAKDKASGQAINIQAKALVNAAGPWINNCFDQVIKQKSPQHIRLVKGSHIVVPKIHDKDHAFILQNADNRIVFVIPYEDDFSLIGTTDVDYQGDPSKTAISAEEVDYLLAITNEYFNHKITKEDVVYTFSGVRPLLDDESSNAQAVTRDYKLELEDDNGNTPLLSVFGGKITTYRKLAKAALDKLSPYFNNIKPCVTAETPLPGGNFDSKDALFNLYQQKYAWLPEAVLKRWVRSYGTRIDKIINGAAGINDLGLQFSADLFQAEVDYLRLNEWATCSDDIIKRRTKLILRMSASEIQKLEHYLAQHSQQKIA